MTFSKLSNFRTFQMTLALAGGICGASAPAFAQVAQPPVASLPSTPDASDTDTIRLADEQREAILSANSEERAADARGELTGPQGLGRGIHGEVGVMIGSNGTRGAYGEAEIPLGDNAAAAVSFESSRFGYRRSRAIPR